MKTKLRMLLASATCDPGLVEVSPFRKRNLAPTNPITRRTNPKTGRVEDVDATGEVVAEYLRGVLSISLTFVVSGPQASSFDEVADWATDYFKRGGTEHLDVTIEAVR